MAQLCGGTVEGEAMRWVEGVRRLLPRVAKRRMELDGIVCGCEDLRLRVVVEPVKCTCFVAQGEDEDEEDDE